MTNGAGDFNGIFANCLLALAIYFYFDFEVLDFDTALAGGALTGEKLTASFD